MKVNARDGNKEEISGGEQHLIGLNNLAEINFSHQNHDRLISDPLGHSSVRRSLVGDWPSRMLDS